MSGGKESKGPIGDRKQVTAQLLDVKKQKSRRQHRVAEQRRIGGRTELHSIPHPFMECLCDTGPLILMLYALVPLSVA